MTYQDVVAQIMEMLGPLTNVSRQSIDENTDLIGDLGLDSLKVMNLMLEVEDRFDISVPMNSIADIKTVGDLGKQIMTWVEQGS